MNELTPRQAEILQLIRDCIETGGFPPTRSEIAKQMGFSSANAAEQHLKALAKKGYIEMIPGSSRAIRLTSDAGLPLVGRVAAGSPILAVEHIETHCRIDPALFSQRPDYLLRVHGMSMKDVGIMDGDLLAVKRTDRAENGQIVVARIDDEVTVKRFRRNGGRIELLPENSEFSPILVDPERESFAIEGLGVGVFRAGIAP